MKAIFRLFRHVTQHLVHWANKETATEIFPKRINKRNGDTLYND